MPDTKRPPIKELRIPTTPEKLAQAVVRGGAPRREPKPS